MANSFDQHFLVAPALPSVPAQAAGLQAMRCPPADGAECAAAPAWRFCHWPAGCLGVRLRDTRRRRGRAACRPAPAGPPRDAHVHAPSALHAKLGQSRFPPYLQYQAGRIKSFVRTGETTGLQGITAAARQPTAGAHWLAAGGGPQVHSLLFVIAVPPGVRIEAAASFHCLSRAALFSAQHLLRKCAAIAL
jgi:hypothetical protein